MFVEFKHELECFIVDCLVPHLEDYFEKCLHSDQFAVKYLNWTSVVCDNLAILLVNMDEEVFKALVDSFSEVAEVKFQ